MRLFTMHEGDLKEGIRHEVVKVLENNFKITIFQSRIFPHFPPRVDIGISTFEHLSELQYELDEYFKEINGAISISSSIQLDFNKMNLYYFYNID